MTGSAYSFKDFTSFLDGYARESGPEDYAGDDIESIRHLSSFFKSNNPFEKTKAFAKSYRAQRSFESLVSLANEYRRIQKDSLSESVIRIRNESEARICLFKVNRDAEIKASSDRYFVLRAPELSKIPKLPEGYAFKGGAARLALAALLGKDVKNRKPRDYDIFRIGSGTPELDLLLAKKYMGEDLKNGHGVEAVQSMDAYLNSRDLTLNQVALFHDELICSHAALEDTLNGVLRPTKHVIDTSGHPQGLITMKMIRMRAEGLLEGKNLNLNSESHNPRVTLFDIALHLDRALSRGTRVAQYYLNECMRLGFLETGGQSIGDTIEAVRSNLQQRRGKKKPSRGAARPRMMARIGKR